MLRLNRSGMHFLPANGNDLYILNEKGHLCLVPQKSVVDCQRSTKNRLSFTREGLVNLQRKYEDVNGAPDFIHQLLSLDTSEPEFKDLLEHPDAFRYLLEEGFLLIPNRLHSASQFPSGTHKLTGSGIALNAWFIHPASGFMTEPTKQVLAELTPCFRGERKRIDALRERARNDASNQAARPSSPYARDPLTIAELGKYSEYLASLLDFKLRHVPMLKSIKRKILAHLREQYRITKSDSVDLYIHFLYDNANTTLHIHARVNQGFHPLEQEKSFSLDQIISWLSDGKSIADLILERQRQNGGGFHKFDLSEFQDIEGVTAAFGLPNPHRLDATSSRAVPVQSRRFDY